MAPLFLDKLAPLILIADDDPAILDLLEIALSEAGYRVIAAADGPLAFELSLSYAPNAILIDVGLPQLSGIEVVKRLRTHEATHAIPAIVISALCDTPTKVSAMNAGAIDYITKPFDLDELEARLARALRLGCDDDTAE